MRPVTAGRAVLEGAGQAWCCCCCHSHVGGSDAQRCATPLQGVLFWKKQGEVALQRSGIDYTIVRPGEAGQCVFQMLLGYVLYWSCIGWSQAYVAPSCAPVRLANVVQALLECMLYWSCIGWSQAYVAPSCALVRPPRSCVACSR